MGQSVEGHRVSDSECPTAVRADAEPMSRNHQISHKVLRCTKASTECVDWHELGRRLAVGPVKDTTAFGLLLNNLLFKIRR